MKVLLLFVCALCAVQGNLAPFITPCKPSDRKCLKTSAQKAVPVFAAGVPALGLETLDPMHMARIKANQAGLDMDFKNTVVKGLRNCEVIDLQRLQHRTLFDLKCSVTLIGDYKLGGRLLIMPIEGHGRYKIKIRDILVKVVLDIGERTVDGEQYWTVSNWRHSYEVLTNAEFQFQNLFNGQKQLADAVHSFANSNWQGIFQEVAPPIVKAIVARIVEETVKFFNKVPIKDLVVQ
ncbi:protein takeout-like [Epargyreus clarus]|uniref:protein takeout-like n=1 Tax=Epargyreus clarus TaxID=520877 RepID=UPI003C2B622D